MYRAQMFCIDFWPSNIQRSNANYQIGCCDCTFALLTPHSMSGHFSFNFWHSHLIWTKQSVERWWYFVFFASICIWTKNNNKKNSNGKNWKPSDILIENMWLFLRYVCKYLKCHYGFVCGISPIKSFGWRYLSHWPHISPKLQPLCWFLFFSYSCAVPFVRLALVCFIFISF